MTSNSTLNTLAQEVIAQLPVTFVGRYTVLCGAVLLLYDILLTFPKELQYIWRGKMNIMKILFVLNRYSSLIFLYGEVLDYFIKSETNTECSVFYYFEQISSILAAFAQFSIFTLRTYAIYGRSKVVLFLLAVPTFVELSSEIWIIVTQTAVALPPELQIGPDTCDFIRASSSNTASVVDFVSGAVFDALVVILTVPRTGRLALQSRKVGISGSLSFIMARDGMLYYSAIFVPQLVLIALNVVVLKTGSENLGDVSDALGSINDALQVILVNRLVLSLSNAANAREDSEFRTRTGLEPPTFAAGPVLGNIGGSLRTLPDDLDDEILNVVEIVDADEVQGETTEPASANGAGELSGIIEFRHDTGIADV